ncbi:MAG: S1 RNA-binding domain-containing protein, partial [Thermodesulfobacteriota bacterium]|nr:S1 RNA-binding domain-containing protein [Thermodesulfobacteriota bacterium]
IFVEVEEGIEGLVHVSEISKEKITTPVGMYNVGDMLKTKVINVSAKDRKIGLSVKALTDKSAEGSYVDYQRKQAASGPSTIGDLLKEEFGKDNAEPSDEQDNQ